MEDFDQMTLEDLIVSQERDDVPFVRTEGSTLLLGGAIEWIDQHLDRDSDAPVPIAHLPHETRPTVNGNAGATDNMHPWFPKLRVGDYTPRKKGCRKHGFEFWSTPGSQPYCKKCRAERYYAMQERRGATPRGRKYA